ncbi:uncharacterized protein PG986_000820 [Apiospora aurea]|uniref:Uncharacterized protein n=1 Tax=Apiospora aurea TaxID=335848 RepID=A0ABR1QVS3_9PEZI
MSTPDQEYFNRIWQTGREWLVTKSGGHAPLITILSQVIRDNVTKLDGARTPRVDFLWSIASELWSTVCGDDQLGQRRPQKQGIAPEADMLTPEVIREVTIAKYETVDDLIDSLMKVPASKKPTASFVPPSTKPRGGLAESPWAKAGPVTTKPPATQTSVAKPPPSTPAAQTSVANPSGNPPAAQTSAAKPATQPTEDLGSDFFTLVGAKAKTPRATEPVAKYSLSSLGLPPAHPNTCLSYEVKLPRDVKVSECVVPYMATLGKLLGVKVHRSKTDRGLPKDVLDMDNEIKVRRAYDIFLRWTADMYKNKKAKDLTKFVQGVMVEDANSMLERSKTNAGTVDRGVQTQWRVAPPDEFPENSHFYSPRPGEAAEQKQRQPEQKPEQKPVEKPVENVEWPLYMVRAHSARDPLEPY